MYRGWPNTCNNDDCIAILKRLIVLIPSLHGCERSIHLYSKRSFPGFFFLIDEQKLVSMTAVPSLILQQHRKQCLMRIVLMARTFRLLSDEGLLGVAYDPKQRDFSVMDAVAEEVLEEEEERKALSSSDEGSEPGSEVSCRIYVLQVNTSLVPRLLLCFSMTDTLEKFFNN